MRSPRYFQSPMLSRWIWGAVVVVAIGVAWISQSTWLPPLRALASGQLGSASKPIAPAHAEDSHAGHDYGDAAPTVELSKNARLNIGLTTGQVSLQPFEQCITVPGMIVERPGKTTIKVAAPVTGVITGVYAVPGESISAGVLLFKLRLTHEDVVQAQTSFLRTLGELDVETREVERLGQITSGALAGRSILEHRYAQAKLEAALQAEREALALHGISEDQIATIEEKRMLLREIEVMAPVLHADASLHEASEAEHAHPPNAANSTDDHDSDHHHAADSQSFVVVELIAGKGQAVQSGDPLCVVADFSELYIEGRAFEQDADDLIAAANKNLTVSAVLESQQQGVPTIVTGLELSHVANSVDADSRALHFYVHLPNTIVRDSERSDGRHFRTWKYKIGQRVQVRVPIKTWPQAIVLPVDAVAQEGPDSFAFVQSGNLFGRRSVQVEFRDQYSVVVANNGSIFPGETVAMNGAHQLQMAIKNRSGGAPDPHAGHNH